MKRSYRKILSVFLLLFYLTSTLGFVVSEKNCVCCSSDVECGVSSEAETNCCAPKPELPACCAPEKDELRLSADFCKCDQFKCDKSEYYKVNQKVISVKTEITVAKVKSLVSANIVDFSDLDENHKLNIIKSNPPPILFKDSSFIISISKLKIPTA